MDPDVIHWIVEILKGEIHLNCPFVIGGLEIIGNVESFTVVKLYVYHITEMTINNNWSVNPSTFCFFTDWRQEQLEHLKLKPSNMDYIIDASRISYFKIGKKKQKNEILMKTIESMKDFPIESFTKNVYCCRVSYFGTPNIEYFKHDTFDPYKFTFIESGFDAKQRIGLGLFIPEVIVKKKTTKLGCGFGSY